MILMNLVSNLFITKCLINGNIGMLFREREGLGVCGGSKAWIDLLTSVQISRDMCTYCVGDFRREFTLCCVKT